jgi:phospholipid transport system transporter-binding protein
VTTTARLESLGSGRFRLNGVLDATTVANLLTESQERFATAPSIDVDLGGVTEADSAGLALLIEWLRGARERSQRIVFRNVPGQLNALAKISEVDELLSAAEPAVREAAGSAREVTHP